MIRTCRLSELKDAFGGTLVNEDAGFSQLVIDSRTVAKGDLFLALKGVRFDAHQFCDQVIEAGACALVVSDAQPSDIPQWVVPDTQEALAQIAQWNRGLFHGPLVSVTGNSGKTTVKEMLGSILSLNYEPLITQGNLNNEIGVPLTLLRLSAEHSAAVVELGANHLGEIASTARIASPDVGIVLNVTGAHLGEFGSLENIAKAKGELLEALPDEGCAIINADDDWSSYWRDIAGNRRTLLYTMIPSEQNPKACRAEDEVIRAEAVQRSGCGYQFDLCLPSGRYPVRLKVPARHNVSNALAAAAGAFSLGVSVEHIVRGLETFVGVNGRLQTLTGQAGATLLNDSYNANPGAVKAGIDTLIDFPGRHILVLGDVGELGDEATSLHFQMGRYARDAGVSQFWSVGNLSEHAARGFGENARHFHNRDMLIDALKRSVCTGDVILIKGSRSSAMDEVVEAMKSE